MEYFEPKSLGEAVSLLKRYGEGAKVIAGGTDVLVDMKFKEEPLCLVNIKRLPGMSYIREDNGCLRIGALTPIREVETSSLVRLQLPLLWQAAHQFASLQIRNTATIGGNVCRASPSGEVLAPLLVLEACAHAKFPKGEKKLPFGELFLGPGQTLLGSSGLLKEIEIPLLPEKSGSVYLKHAVRGAMDIAMVGVAVLVTADSTGKKAKEVRIGLGAVAPTPIRAKSAEKALQGKVMARGLIEEAARRAAADAKPITDHRASAEYRRWIVEALTRKGLAQAWQAATGKEVEG
jgi:carbon-monoxide dehydrogenase medium subunit